MPEIKMLDTTLTEDTSPEEMIEFENPFEGEVFLIKAEDIKECELQLELSRLRQVAQHLHAPSHLARVAEDPEEWAKFASLIIGRANI
jgi:hypothetical protein